MRLTTTSHDVKKGHQAVHGLQEPLSLLVAGEGAGGERAGDAGHRVLQEVRPHVRGHQAGEGARHGRGVHPHVAGIQRPRVHADLRAALRSEGAV